MRTSRSIVPADTDRDIYLVLDDLFKVDRDEKGWRH
jgi:hypothetical protein